MPGSYSFSAQTKSKSSVSAAAHRSVAENTVAALVDNRTQTSVRQKQNSKVATTPIPATAIQRKKSASGQALNVNALVRTGFDFVVQGQQQNQKVPSGINTFQTATIQRRIVNMGPPTSAFIVIGRAGRHATAANRNALAELRAHRSAAPNAATRHVNNEREEAVATGAATITGLGLHMAHHVSDSVIQIRIMQAANAYNAAAVQTPALFAGVQAYIAGIAPPAAIVGVLPNFYAASVAAHATAMAALAVVTAVHPIPLNAAMAAQLTILANAIANSPMNLHLGDGPRNMSIGHHGDPNTHPPDGLQRQMTWRSHQMRAALAGAGINPAQHDRTLPDALGMPGTVAGAQAAAFPAVAAGTAHAYIHNSGSLAGFTQLI